MKYLIILLFALFQISCSTTTDKKEIIEQNKITDIQVEEVKPVTNQTDLSRHHTELDTVHIITERGDTFSYKKSIYNQIINNHPEFFENYPYSPQRSYQTNHDFEYFGSEVGQDSYYVLYTYFLKKKNGNDILKNERNKLIEIYTHINSIFQRLQYGGTYFGHQYYRILGFAEYSLYLMPKNKTEFEKTYDISKQKALYIESLRQLIQDESSIDFNTIDKEKKLKRLKELNETIDNLEKLISDIFFLRRAQEFQYEYYEYY